MYYADSVNKEINTPTQPNPTYRHANACKVFTRSESLLTSYSALSSPSSLYPAFELAIYLVVCIGDYARWCRLPQEQMGVRG